MKYIRTKDCIWQYDRNGNVVRPSEDGKSIVYWLHFNKKEIIKQADTIEELCDELVVHNPSNDGEFYPKHFVYQNKWETMLKPMSDYQKTKGIEIFGAIWTDKGLIYVAKMNEKGELCLI